MTELFAGATKLLASVGKERWRCRGSCWRYLLPRRRRGRCLLGCVSWVGRSSSGGSHCSAAPGSRALGRFGATTDGKICAPCMIRGARAAKSAPSWQDLRAVRSRKAVCGAFRMHGAHILPKPAHFGCMARESCRELAIFPSATTFGMHGAQNLPRIAARERTAAESRHGKTPGNASRENIATASQAKGASVRSPATVGRWGTHFASILPSSSARERTVAKSCHYQSPENAFAKILPWTNAWIRPAPNNCRPPRKKTAPKAGLGERPLSEVRKTECWRGWDEQRGTARCSAIAEHSGTHRGGISPWPITRPETKEGEHFARLLLLFCLRLEWPSGPSR